MMRDHPLCVSEAKHRRGGVSSEPNFRLVRRDRQHEQKVFVFIDNRVLCTYKALKVLSIETATMRTNCTPTPNGHQAATPGLVIPCANCGGTVRWNDKGTMRCVACWPREMC